MKQLFALLVTMMISAAAYADIQASYDIYMSGMQVGQMQETYNRQGNNYTLASTTTPQGLFAAFKPGKIYFSSRGTVDKLGLHPQHFEETRPNNPEKNSAADFDWTTQQLTLTHHDQRAQLDLPEDTQDRLSAMYQFMFVPFGKADFIEFHMTNGSKLDSYRYAILPQQKLITPAGKFDVLYLDNQGKPGESRTEIWLDTKHHFPCKMIITDAKGDQIMQILNALKIEP